YRIAAAHQCDAAQRADRLYAAARVQRVRHRGQAADEIRAGAHDVAEHEYAYRAELAERDTRAHADHLLRDTLRNGIAELLVGQPCDIDRSDLGERDRAVAAYGEPVVLVLIAE